jgi:hypothetical protein
MRRLHHHTNTGHEFKPGGTRTWVAVLVTWCDAHMGAMDVSQFGYYYIPRWATRKNVVNTLGYTKEHCEIPGLHETHCQHILYSPAYHGRGCPLQWGTGVTPGRLHMKHCNETGVPAMPVMSGACRGAMTEGALPAGA